MRRTLVVVAVIALTGQGLVAEASHPSMICLEVEPERGYPVSNDDKTDQLTATVGSTDAGHPPEQEGCVFDDEASFEGTNIDFEIVGSSDPDEGDTPQTPDATCTVAAGENSCAITPPVAAGGDQEIGAWIDNDNEDNTTEMDLDEAPDEEAEPGAQEPDATDVALWSWTHGDPPPPDGEEYDTTVSIRSSRNKLEGNVSSTKARCVRYRILSVKKVRPGKDLLVGRTKADLDGEWQLSKPDDLKGRVYARVGRYDWTVGGTTNTCLADRSRTLEVP